MNGQKILLADDSPTIRKVVELTFEDEGIEVVSVADGDEAMKRFVDLQPDLVLADVNMPGINGYHLCEMIKQDESTRHIPVILLVGSFEPFDAGEASRVGSNYYFTKPFRSIRELVEKVTDYLNLGSGLDDGDGETADIDELYSHSFQDTLDLDRQDEHMDLVTAEPEVQTREAAEIEPPLSETAVAARLKTELGDPGMDDELIDIVHPNANDDTPTDGEASPFDAVAASVSALEGETRAPESEKDASMAAYDWTDPQTAGVETENAPFEALPTVEPPKGPLRLVLDDVEHPASDKDPQFDRTLEMPSPTTEHPAGILPEVLDAIVARVLERMSDHAVRDVAQEAVPRIAEKLIREALDEEKKKQ